MQEHERIFKILNCILQPIVSLRLHLRNQNRMKNQKNGWSRIGLDTRKTADLQLFRQRNKILLCRKKIINVDYINSIEHLSDICTNSLNKEKFIKFRSRSSNKTHIHKIETVYLKVGSSPY